MIGNPIRLTDFGPLSWGHLRRSLRGQQLFGISEEGGALYLVDITDRETYSHHFMISSRLLVRDDGKIKNNLASEEFVDLMFKNYPDHFEWLLFHPEWLL